MKITHAAGRRYYLHQALRVYHTEGTGRLTAMRHTRCQQALTYRYIGEDRDYLRLLRETNPQKYVRVKRKARQGRMVSAIACRKGSPDT